MAFTIDMATPFGERAQRRLREEHVAWLTTTSEDATPQPVPVWFLWDGADSILIYSKPGATGEVRGRTPLSYRYRDAALGAWVRRVSEVLSTEGEVERCQEQFLAPEELATVRRQRAEGF